MSDGPTPKGIGRVRSEVPVLRQATIRSLNSGDAHAVHLLASSLPEVAQWREESYRAAGTSGLSGWAAVLARKIAGFIVMRVAASEMEILNLVIAPEARRKGLATRLLGAAFTQARAAGVTRAFLEVRESNSAARSLYASFGFQEGGRRQRYYANPTEDALLLSMEIGDC
jgi:[ribosomal protein S18]-alanine N-acetyltransferase